MGRLSQFDADALTRLLGRQSGVISRSQAVACAMTEAAVRHRIRPDGPWQTLLPGVYLTSRKYSEVLRQGRLVPVTPVVDRVCVARKVTALAVGVGLLELGEPKCVRELVELCR